MFVYTGRVHGRVHGPYAVTGRTRPYRAAWERVHGPVGLPGVYTALVHGRVTAGYTGRYSAVFALCRRPKTAVYTAEKWPCTRPVHCSVHEPIRPIHSRIHNTLHGRVDGRFRPSRWPVHGRVHGPCTRRNGYAAVYVSYTRPCARPVHGRVHSRVRGRVCAMYTAEDVRTDGPYTVMYTGGVDGPCARPIHGRVRAVYTARPLYGRVRDVFAGVHGRRVTGTRHVTRPCTRPCTHVTRPCTRPVRGRTTAVYMAVDGLYTAV